jgi:hypothetical protein
MLILNHSKTTPSVDLSKAGSIMLVKTNAHNYLLEKENSTLRGLLNAVWHTKNIIPFKKKKAVELLPVHFFKQLGLFLSA